MYRQYKQLGFTLVEIMVVVAIFAILATAAVPAYQTWIQNTRIRNAAESIQNGISKARSEALMRNTSVRFTLGANSAWVVECVDAAKCPDLPAGLVESRTSSDGSSAEISTAQLPGGATQVIYTNLGVKSAAPGQLTQVAVDNTSMSDSRELNVAIGVGGNVRMCDPNAATTDPRKC
jgi:type IV fimbrial biogenesis protein FimT